MMDTVTSNIAMTTGKPNALGHEYADWQRAQGIDPAALIAEKAASPPPPPPPPPKIPEQCWPCARADRRSVTMSHRISIRPTGVPKKRLNLLRKIAAKISHGCLASIRLTHTRRLMHLGNIIGDMTPKHCPGPLFSRGATSPFQAKLTDAGIDFQSQAKPPLEWDDKRMQASYYAMIEQLDHEFGRTLDYLDAEGIRENTNHHLHF